jgi:hypothetical protein
VPASKPFEVRPPLALNEIVETSAYTATAADMTDKEREAVLKIVAEDPMAGELIRETGRCRKVRVGREGGGKSGGYRIITFYAPGDGRAFLLMAYPKSRRDTLDAADKKALKRLAKSIKEG